MKVMVFVKATTSSETEDSPVPTEQLLADMMQFNQELTDAGILLAGDGLKPSKFGARVLFDGDKRTVIDGPFAETKELIAGYWMWKVKDLQEAISWVKRCPHPHPGHDTNIEIRPLYELDDFGEAMTPELRAKDEAMRREIEKR